MPIKTSNWCNCKDVKTYDELKNDKFGVLLKNTGTICSDKQLNIEEERRRNLKNREIPKEDLEEYYYNKDAKL